MPCIFVSYRLIWFANTVYISRKLQLLDPIISLKPHLSIHLSDLVSSCNNNLLTNKLITHGRLWGTDSRQASRNMVVRVGKAILWSQCALICSCPLFTEYTCNVNRFQNIVHCQREYIRSYPIVSPSFASNAAQASVSIWGACTISSCPSDQRLRWTWSV